MNKTILLLGSIALFANASCDSWMLEHHPESCISDEISDTQTRQIIQDSTIMHSVIRSEVDDLPVSGTIGGAQTGVGMVYAGNATVIDVPYAHAISSRMRVKAAVPIVKNDISKESGLGDILIGATHHYGSTRNKFGHVVSEVRATLPTGSEKDFLGAGAMGLTLAGSGKKEMNDFQLLANASYTFYIQESDEYAIDYGSTMLLMGGLEKDCQLIEKTKSRAKILYTSKASDTIKSTNLNNESISLDAYLSWSSSSWIPTYPIEAGLRIPLIHDEGKNTDDNRAFMFFVNTAISL